jgi:hypothetical protein
MISAMKQSAKRRRRILFCNAEIMGGPDKPGHDELNNSVV